MEGWGTTTGNDSLRARATCRTKDSKNIINGKELEMFNYFWDQSQELLGGEVIEVEFLSDYLKAVEEREMVRGKTRRETVETQEWYTAQEGLRSKFLSILSGWQKWFNFFILTNCRCSTVSYCRRYLSQGGSSFCEEISKLTKMCTALCAIGQVKKKDLTASRMRLGQRLKTMSTANFGGSGIPVRHLGQVIHRCLTAAVFTTV